MLGGIQQFLFRPVAFLIFQVDGAAALAHLRTQISARCRQSYCHHKDRQPGRSVPKPCHLIAQLLTGKHVDRMPYQRGQNTHSNGERKLQPLKGEERPLVARQTIQIAVNANTPKALTASVTPSDWTHLREAASFRVGGYSGRNSGRIAFASQ